MWVEEKESTFGRNCMKLTQNLAMWSSACSFFHTADSFLNKLLCASLLSCFLERGTSQFTSQCAWKTGQAYCTIHSPMSSGANASERINERSKQQASDWAVRASKWVSGLLQIYRSESQGTCPRFHAVFVKSGLSGIFPYWKVDRKFLRKQ